MWERPSYWQPMLVSLHISTVNAVSNVNRWNEACAVLTDPMTQWPQRVNLAQMVLQSDTAVAGHDVVLETYAVCATHRWWLSPPTSP